MSKKFYKIEAALTLVTTANDGRNWESKTQKNQRGDPLNWKSEKFIVGSKMVGHGGRPPSNLFVFSVDQKFSQKSFVPTAAVTRAELLKIIRKILRIRIL